MKKSLALVIAIIMNLSLFSQKSNSYYTASGSGSGYVNITEINSGIGLGDNSANNPYSKYNVGFTNVSSYQLSFKQDFMDNKILQFGGGTGYYAYNDGSTVPIFTDFRFIMTGKKIEPYFYLQGGGLINAREILGTGRMFGNAGGGIRYPLNNTMALNLGIGLMVQVGPQVPRDSFFSIKLGFSFLPAKK